MGLGVALGFGLAFGLGFGLAFGFGLEVELGDERARGGARRDAPRPHLGRGDMGEV